MSFMPILDVAIGLSMLYLLLGLVGTTVTESIAGWRRSRATFLQRGLIRLFNGDTEVTTRFYQHPLIRALTSAESDRPSYIPANKFATVMLDLLSGPENPLTDANALRAGAQRLGNEDLRRSVTALLDSAGGDAAAVRAEIEAWFNDSMDRVSGWYKRSAQVRSLVTAVVVTLVLNVDTLSVARILWTNPAVRSAVVEEARIRASKAPPEELPLVEYANPDDATESKLIETRTAAEVLSENEQKLLGDLTGWREDWDRIRAGEFSGAAWLATLLHLPGWLITALAASLGAPFWFDMLNRFMNIRNAGRASDERRDKSTPGAAATVRT